MASPFSFPKGPSFGGGDTTSRPKSPKVTAVENPYLKIVAMGGGASGPSGGASQSMSMSRGFQTPQYQYNMTRDPLVSLQGGGGLGTQQTAHAKRPKPTSSLPPPNMSLSLMEGTLPMPMVSSNGASLFDQWSHQSSLQVGPGFRNQKRF